MDSLKLELTLLCIWTETKDYGGDYHPEKGTEKRTKKGQDYKIATHVSIAQRHPEDTSGRMLDGR